MSFLSVSDSKELEFSPQILEKTLKDQILWKSVQWQTSWSM